MDEIMTKNGLLTLMKLYSFLLSEKPDFTVIFYSKKCRGGLLTRPSEMMFSLIKTGGLIPRPYRISRKNQTLKPPWETVIKPMVNRL